MPSDPPEALDIQELVREHVPELVPEPLQEVRVTVHVLGLAASVAQDLKDSRIRVTTITPGRTDTPMARESDMWNPDLGWLSPEAVADAVVFCVKQRSETIIPEFHLHHRAEL